MIFCTLCRPDLSKYEMSKKNDFIIVICETNEPDILSCEMNRSACSDILCFRCSELFACVVT